MEGSATGSPRPRPRPRRRRGLRRVSPGGWIAVLAILGVVAATVALARPAGDAIPPGTHAGAFALGGLSVAEASRRLGVATSSTTSRTIRLTSGSDRFALRLASIRLRPDTAAIAAEARRRSGPLDRVLVRLGLAAGPHVPVLYTWEQPALDRVLRPIDRAAGTPAVAADVRVDARGALRLVRGRGGVEVDRAALGAALRRADDVGATVEVPLRRVEAGASTEDARRALTAARLLLSTPHAVELLGHDYPIAAAALRRALDFVPDGGAVRMRIARGPIRDELRRLFGDAETEPVNARFAVDAAGAITIVPSAPGAIVDPDVVRHALETEPSRRVVPVRIAKVQPSFTTALATRLHVTDEVGSFTTPYDPGLPRVTNIQRAAELLDGTILEAGETFSLNQRLGERTLDRGFVLAPQIETGELKDAVGGGVSQVATTLFNAAFMSGLRLDAHTAHEFYISRYPPGREATVSWGGPEMVFTNDWPAPLVILVEAGTDHITVRFFSRRLGRRVEYGTDAPTDSKPPKERRVLNPALAPGTRTVLQDAGSAGFTIGYWRKVYRDGRLSRDERFTTHYRPEDRIVEVGPKPKPKPKPSTASGTTGTATGPGSTGPDAGATTISG